MITLRYPSRHLPHFLQDDPPLRSRVSDAMTEQSKRDGQEHDQHVHTSLCAECFDVASFRYPRNDTVEEAKANNVLH